ncbi:MAG: BMP family ABC transporter substrate-binding protein [Clostridia bacterium]|nr:BMP family ABC transporter substrate-binding protein [Clostridia bacterium]MBR6512488.1 BMP family ABC transporter substrate-binding protein [Clostridia bacterium]
MRRLFAVVLAVVMILTLAACTKVPANNNGGEDKAALKVGLICLHDENSTYDKNFIDGFKAACEKAGLKEGESFFIMTNIPEGAECKEAALDLADKGCTLIFADSFGHEPYMIEAAKECPDVQFCHATGTKAHTEKLANFHNAFASIYEGRYLAGVAAGLKINEMIEAGTIKAEEAKIGYVGAFPYAEVKSGYTSFFLGARSVCETATMEVIFTNSWYDETLEKEAAQKLIGDKCILISQHADSYGAPTACEDANVPDVSYNGSTEAQCPNTFIVSSRIDWEPYYTLCINAVKSGDAIPTDYVGTIETGSVVLTDLGAKAPAAGTAEKLAEVKAGLQDGSIKVFDTATFTVDGKTVDSYLADVDDMGDYVGETEVIKDGAFLESEFRSAPYFDLDIDGITIKE